METDWSDEGLNPKHHDIIMQLMSEMGLTEPLSIDVKVATSPGDNYLGCVFRVTAKGKRNNTLQEEQWIIKTMPGNYARRETFDIPIYFSNEIVIYKHVIPSLTSLLSAEQPSLAIARCFHTFCDGINDILVLEDLRPQNFCMADRKMGLDAKHCSLVLQELAHLHALSLIMKFKYPERFQNLKESVEKSFGSIKREKLHDFSKIVVKAVKLIQKSFDKDSNYLKKLNQFICNDYAETMIKLRTHIEEPWAVITHGDCWTNNLLFRYTEDGTPNEVRLLDFQLSRYASPTFDIAYLMCCCTTSATRRAHFTSLLDDYHNKLVAVMESLGGTSLLYPREKLDEEMLLRGGRWGMGKALIIMNVLCWNTGEMPYKGSVPSSDEGFGAAEGSSDLICQERLSDILRDLVDLNLL